MRIAAKNRHEIWLSFGAALLALIFAMPMPMAYGNVLMLVGCLLVSLCCAVNAVLDLEAMTLPAKIFAVLWLAVVLVTADSVLIWAFGIQGFANK